jgi:hypothetical protein
VRIFLTPSKVTWSLNTVHTYGKEEEKAEAKVDALVVETAVKRLFLI